MNVSLGVLFSIKHCHKKKMLPPSVKKRWWVYLKLFV